MALEAELAAANLLSSEQIQLINAQNTQIHELENSIKTIRFDLEKHLTDLDQAREAHALTQKELAAARSAHTGSLDERIQMEAIITEHKQQAEAQVSEAKKLEQQALEAQTRLDAMALELKQHVDELESLRGRKKQAVHPTGEAKLAQESMVQQDGTLRPGDEEGDSQTISVNDETRHHATNNAPVVITDLPSLLQALRTFSLAQLESTTEYLTANLPQLVQQHEEANKQVSHNL